MKRRPPRTTLYPYTTLFRSVDDMKPQAIEAALGAEGIAVRAGLHCAPWAHKWLGTMENGGTVRDFQKLNYPRNDILLQEKFAWRNDHGTNRGGQSAAVEHSRRTQGQRAAHVYGTGGTSSG